MAYTRRFTLFLSSFLMYIQLNASRSEILPFTAIPLRIGNKLFTGVNFWGRVVGKECLGNCLKQDLPTRRS